MGTLFIILVVGAPIAGIIYWGIQQERKRRLAIQAIAERQGWAFLPNAPLSIIPVAQQFGLFTHGRGQEIRNFASGARDGNRVAVFDFSYVTGSGKSKTTWRQTVAYVHSPELDVPRFALRPEHVFHKIGGLFGFRDIDVDSDPLFSKQYLLRGEDEGAIRALFGENLREFFLRHPKSSTEASGPDLFFWRTSRLSSPDAIPSLVEQGLDLAARLRRESAAQRRLRM